MGLDVTLPSGNSISFRDEMWRGDERRIRRGTKFVTAPDGSRVMDAAFIDDLAGRIVTEMIVSWSWGPPTPKDCHGEDLAQRLLDERLNGPDWRMLKMALAPWIDDILTVPGSGRTFTHNGTGVRVTAETDEGAAKLAASGDFTSADTSAAPKSMPTGTFSAALPAGQDPNGVPTQ